MTMQLQNTEIGENIGSGTMAGLTRNADGTLTLGTTYPLLTTLENINPSFENTIDGGSITASPFKNNTKIESGVNCEVTGWILKNDSVATPTNRLRFLIQNFDYLQFTWTQAGVVNTYAGLVENYKPIMNGKTFLKYSLSMVTIDIGGPNLVQS